MIRRLDALPPIRRMFVPARLTVWTRRPTQNPACLTVWTGCLQKRQYQRPSESKEGVAAYFPYRAVRTARRDKGNSRVGGDFPLPTKKSMDVRLPCSFLWESSIEAVFVFSEWKKQKSVSLFMNDRSFHATPFFLSCIMCDFSHLLPQCLWG